jgi:hypothetical protein
LSEHTSRGSGRNEVSVATMKRQRIEGLQVSVNIDAADGNDIAFKLCRSSSLLSLGLELNNLGSSQHLMITTKSDRVNDAIREKRQNRRVQ